MVLYEDFKKLDMRIAEIEEATKHPDADRLYVLRINLGEEKRQIVAGIVSTYSSDELKGKRIVVVVNLEPAVIRGVESNGMLLAAGSDEGPILITTEKEAPLGSRIK